LPDHWVSELGSIRGNMPKWRAPWKYGRSWKYYSSASSDSAHVSLNQYVCRKGI
jgi:hypothetical protein